MEHTEILKRPIITEKYTNIPAKSKGKRERYAFVVDGRANKIQIKDAVEQMYGIQVEEVNTLNYKGKFKQRYTKTRILSGRTPSYKKAIVTLREGEFINLYEDAD